MIFYFPTKYRDVDWVINMLAPILKYISETIIRILSIIYVSLFLGIRVKGMCDIHAFSFEGGRIRRQITGGRGSEIHRGVRIRTRLTLEENVYIGERCQILGGDIGSSVFIGRGTRITGDAFIMGNVRIGRYCVMGAVYLLAQDHIQSHAAWQRMFILKNLGVELPLAYKGAIEIGSDVGMSYRAFILPGVHIADGAGIAAGSVVTKDVPPYSITGGVTARHIKYRFSPETITRLLELKWWDWPIDRIQRNIEFFTTDLNSVENIDSLIVE